MRKFVDFEDGFSWELSPLSYSEFERLNRWSGSPDIAFEQWKRHNSFFDLEDLSPDPEPKDKPGIRIEFGEPVIDWLYCEDAWWMKD